MARNDDGALLPARQALAGALGAYTQVDRDGYCEQVEDNLIANVGPGLWRQVRADLATGKGAELEKKFRAAYSSSALAVNAFAPLLDRVDLRDGLQVRGPAVRAGEIRIGTRIPANP